MHAYTCLQDPQAAQTVVQGKGKKSIMIMPLDVTTKMVRMCRMYGLTCMCMCTYPYIPILIPHIPIHTYACLHMPIGAHEGSR